MSTYYVNKIAQSNGDHEVHTTWCFYLLDPKNRVRLGEFVGCQSAVSAAKQYYTQVNGCYNCCKECHTTIEELLDALVRHWLSEAGTPMRNIEGFDKHYIESRASILAKNPESGDNTERLILRKLNKREWKNLPSLIKRGRALEELAECFVSDFIGADSAYEERYSDALSRAEYDAEKASFVKSWAKNHAKANLDHEQSAAIASYGKNIQVVARAGSGKTTTLVNRAIFLQKHCHVLPSQILLLAFNKEAAKEMKKRLTDSLGENTPHAMTFHALANAIVHPEKNPLHDDSSRNSYAKSSVLQEIICNHIRDPKFKGKIRDLMLENFRADWENIIFGGYDMERDDFIEYRRSLPKISLRGEYLKSYGEKLIANFFFEHDVAYIYEKKFLWNGSPYRPDFTVHFSADSGIIVEYFGLRGDSQYDKQIEEKRKYWQENRSWKLLEIYPEDVSMDRNHFFAYFKGLLEKNGVKCQPLTEDEIWSRIKEWHPIKKFPSAMAGFVQQCRKRPFTPNELRDLVRSQHEFFPSEKQFLEIAECIYSAYLTHLDAEGEEDFDGLMQQAIEKIREGQTAFKRKDESGELNEIRYLLVDEYQDFSGLFFNLVNAIRTQNDKVELFCVGDDWQAINGFAGSDLKFYESFERYFSPSKKLYISTNYRSSKSIVEMSNALMSGLGEPGEPDKENNGTILLADYQQFSPSKREKERCGGDKITPMVLRIVSKYLADGKKVVLLSRRNTLPWYVNYGSARPRGLEDFGDRIRSYFPKEVGDNISVSTTHSYKGLQGDVVVILDAVSSSYPLVHPNWIFTRILGNSIEKVIEEERRLFYVALTRAVDTLIILSEENEHSLFLQKLLDEPALHRINWDSFPPVKDQNSHLTVQVSDYQGDAQQQWHLRNDAHSGTFAIKDELKNKDDRYRWNSLEKLWWKSFPEEGFSLEKLKNTLWSKKANQVCVRIMDADDTIVGEYVIYSGKWNAIREYTPKAAKTSG